jgi:Flp pilus assembly protein TadD
MRAFKGICLGLLLNFPYGLIPGFFILAILVGLSSWFLPGVTRMWDSTFGPMALMVISIIVGIFIFPVAGAIWFSKDKKEKKTRLVLTTLLIHTCIAYGLLVPILLYEPLFDDYIASPTEEEQPTPQESSTPISTPTPTSIPVPTSTPHPTPKEFNHFEQGEKYLWQDENYVKAVESFTEYINLNPNDAKGYERRGNSYQELRRYQEALTDYDKAIELNPKSSDVYGKRGHIYGDLGKYQEAIKDYDKWLKLDPETLWPYAFKGRAYMQLEQYEVAIQNWETYVELRLIVSADWIESEQAANSYTNIGLAYVELGQYQEAIDHFDRALAIDQTYSYAISGREKATKNIKR